MKALVSGISRHRLAYRLALWPPLRHPATHAQRQPHDSADTKWHIGDGGLETNRETRGETRAETRVGGKRG